MATESMLQAESFRERLLGYWTGFSKTVVGDILSTVVAITGVSVLFLACSFGVIGLARAGGALLRLVGAG